MNRLYLIKDFIPGSGTLRFRPEDNDLVRRHLEDDFIAVLTTSGKTDPAVEMIARSAFAKAFSQAWEIAHELGVDEQKDRVINALGL